MSIETAVDGHGKERLTVFSGCGVMVHVFNGTGYCQPTKAEVLYKKPTMENAGSNPATLRISLMVRAA